MIQHKECRYGPMLYLDNDQWVGRSFHLYSEAFECQIAFMLRFIKPDDVVVDGGANIGTMTVPFAQNARMVHSFEPQEFLYFTLCGNIAVNNLYNVKPYMRPLDVVSNRLVYFPPACSWYEKPNHFAGCDMQERSSDGLDVPLNTMSIDSMELNQVGFIKLDVEGQDYRVMRGARETIERCRPIMFIETNPWEMDLAAGSLKAHDYVGYMIKTAYFNPQNAAEKAEDVLRNEPEEPMYSHDVICWHKERHQELRPIFDQALEECHGVDCIQRFGV